MKRPLLRFTNQLYIFLICCFCCISCKEEDDKISEPTPTSTFIKGTAKTSNGQPLANVTVKLDYNEGVWMGPQLTRHKAEGKTDGNGNYQLFFELKDDELIQSDDSDDNVNRNFNLIFNLDNLPKDIYLMPTDVNSSNDSQDLFFFYSNNSFGKGKTYEHHLYIPQKRWIDVTVVNNQPLGDNDQFFIRNLIAYGGSRRPDNSYGENGLTFIDYPVEMTQDEIQTFRVPCAVNDSNRIALGCMQRGAGYYGIITPVQKIYVTKDLPETVHLENTQLSEQFKFKLKAWSDRRTVAPFENIVFEITDNDGKNSTGMGIPLSLCSYYDSIVWSANGYPDQMVIYRNPDKSKYSYIYQWDCRFFQNKPLYTRLQGYKDGRIVHADSVQTLIGPREFLRYDWESSDISFDEAHSVCKCPLYKEAAFDYYIPAVQGGHLFSKVFLVRNDNEDDDNVFADRARKTLSGLMDYHLGAQKSFDPATVNNLFHCLPAAAKPIAYWETAATRAVLIETENGIYIHAEPRQPIS